MLSIIIPAREEPFLDKTIESLLNNAVGEIEVIPVIDGYDAGKLPDDPRVKPIYFKKPKGMRASINAGIEKSKGEYIMKSDAHCMFCRHYDKIILHRIRKHWLVVPRRYYLDAENWKRKRSRPINYHYIFFPQLCKYGVVMASHRLVGKDGPDIDDIMMFQGSCWVAYKEFFKKIVGKLDDREETYGTFGGEQLEIGLKYWLKGGRVKVNKHVWYAHMAKRRRHYLKGMFNRKYKQNKRKPAQRTWCTFHWLRNEEPGLIHPFSWLIEKFNPPGWPDNWQEEVDKLYAKFAHLYQPAKKVRRRGGANGKSPD